MKKSFVAMLLIVGLVAAFNAAPAQAKKKAKPRVVEIPYQLGGIGVSTPAYTGGVCFVDPSMPASCKEVPLMKGEKTIKIEVQDASGTSVPGFISQGDTDGDGISDGYGEFCGSHEEPVPLADKFAPVNISMWPGVCAAGVGGGIPTTGTIKVTLSK